MITHDAMRLFKLFQDIHQANEQHLATDRTCWSTNWNHSDLARPTCFECGDLELKPHR